MYLFIIIYIIFLNPLISGDSPKDSPATCPSKAHETLASTQRDVALLRAEQPRWRETAELSKRPRPRRWDNWMYPEQCTHGI